MTGRDEYGVRCPLFFRGFNNYQDPVMVYTLVPLLKIFGLKTWVIRLPSALFHLLAAAAFALLAYEYLRNRWWAWIGGFIFAVLPWIFPVSRSVMAGYTPMLLGMILGWYCLLRAFRTRSNLFAVLAGAAWAFTMYAHNIGRPMSAALLVLFVLCFNRALLRRWRIGAVFSASYLGFLVPMIASVLRHPGTLTSRFKTISIWHDNPGLGDLVKRLALRYIDYFNPRFLFFAGDINLRHNTGFGGGLFLFMIPFIAVGLYWLGRYGWRRAYYRFLIAGILVYPLAAILTFDRMHSTRCLNGAPFWCLLALVGMRYLWRSRRAEEPLSRKIKGSFFRGRLQVGRALVMILALGGVFEITEYFRDYFGPYRQRSLGFYETEFNQLLRQGFGLLGAGETLYISASALPAKCDRDFKPHLYAHILFQGRIDPAYYQTKGMPRDRVRAYTGKIERRGILLRCDSLLDYDGKRTVTVAPSPEAIPPNAVLLARIPISFETIKYIPNDRRINMLLFEDENQQGVHYEIYTVVPPVEIRKANGESRQPPPVIPLPSTPK